MITSMESDCIPVNNKAQTTEWKGNKWGAILLENIVHNFFLHKGCTSG